jgi:hypothetical protein
LCHLWLSVRKELRFWWGILDGRALNASMLLKNIFSFFHQNTRLPANGTDKEHDAQRAADQNAREILHCCSR